MWCKRVDQIIEEFLSLSYMEWIPVNLALSFYSSIEFDMLFPGQEFLLDWTKTEPDTGKCNSLFLKKFVKESQVPYQTQHGKQNEKHARFERKQNHRQWFDLYCIKYKKSFFVELGNYFTKILLCFKYLHISFLWSFFERMLHCSTLFSLVKDLTESKG